MKTLQKLYNALLHTLFFFIIKKKEQRYITPMSCHTIGANQPATRLEYKTEL